MTIEQVEGMCFSNREPNYEGVEELCEEDLVYAVTDTVYFRPLKEIISNPRVCGCAFRDGYITITVDGGGHCRILLEDYYKPKVIEEYESDIVTDDTSGEDISIAYYMFLGGWADEYMITHIKPIVNRRLELHNNVRYYK